MPDGSLDRKALAQLVFSSAAARVELENIVHPLISEAMQLHFSQVEAEGHKVAVYCAPLIFEKNLQDLFDAVILVLCDEEVQLSRLIKRDGLTRAEAELRLSAQMPLSEKRQKTAFQIDNSTSILHTAQQLSAVWRKVTGMALNFQV